MEEEEVRMTLDREEEEDRIHSLGLVTKEDSSSQEGRIQMTGGIVGMSPVGQNPLLRRNLKGVLIKCVKM